MPMWERLHQLRQTLRNVFFVADFAMFDFLWHGTTFTHPHNQKRHVSRLNLFIDNEGNSATAAAWQSVRTHDE